MARQYEVRGIDDKAVGITVDGKETVSFQIASDIQAETVYKSLDYRPGDTYQLVDAGAGSLPDKPYEAFRDFLKSVIEGVNEVQTDAAQSVNDSDVNGQLDDSFSEQSFNNGDYEDIPF